MWVMKTNTLLFMVSSVGRVDGSYKDFRNSSTGEEDSQACNVKVHDAREGECGWQILLLILQNWRYLHQKVPRQEFGQALRLKTQTLQQWRSSTEIQDLAHRGQQQHQQTPPRPKEGNHLCQSWRVIRPQPKAAMGFLYSASDRQLQSHLRKQLKVFTTHCNK